MHNSTVLIAAITALLTALTGLLAVVAPLLLRRTKKIDIKVNGHLQRLLDILEQADVTLPSGAKVKYTPADRAPAGSDVIEYIHEIRRGMEEVI